MGRGGLVEHIQLGLSYRTITKLGGGLGGPARFTRSQHFANMQQAERHQRLPQLVRAALRGADLLGVNEIVPRRFRVFLPQVAFAAFQKPAGDLLQQLPRSLVPLSTRLAE